MEIQSAWLCRKNTLCKNNVDVIDLREGERHKLHSKILPPPIFITIFGKNFLYSEEALYDVFFFIFKIEHFSLIWHLFITQSKVINLSIEINTVSWIHTRNSFKNFFLYIKDFILHKDV